MTVHNYTVIKVSQMKIIWDGVVFTTQRAHAGIKMLCV